MFAGNLSPEVVHSLEESGLTTEDMRARQAGPAELSTCGLASSVNALVIPYFNLESAPIQFYRLRIFNEHIDKKYAQAAGTLNHIYFPFGLLKVLKGKNYILLVEGEKKAAACVKNGFPAVAVGGVDSWRNRTILLPQDTKLEQAFGQKKQIRARLSSSSIEVSETHTLANGMSEFMSLLVQRRLKLLICYDTDTPDGLKPEVQTAAALLGYELRFRGMSIKNIRQLVLPAPEAYGDKTAIDSFLLTEGSGALQSLIDECLKQRIAFPRHPNPRQYINKKLQSGRLSRKEAADVGLTLLTELDCQGKRLKDISTGVPYYFDGESKRLISAEILHRHGDPMHETDFGQFLYRMFNISAGDQKVLSWFASQFTGEEPIEDVQPMRILAIHPQDPNCIVYQLSDSQYAKVTPYKDNPIQIMDNGEEGVLFEQDQVEPIDGDILTQEINKQLKKKFEPWWYSVFSSVNMQLKNGADEINKKRDAQLATLLAYISPWLYRWRGTQLPIELMIGEAGSGKSSIYSLRLAILTGRPKMRNMPQDLRDWHASISGAGGMHVIDNVKFVNRDLQQRLSDEMCRLTTEPDPHIEMRRLYTTGDQWRVPINTTFAMTAIQMPFQTTDLMQRSAVFELEAIRTPHDGDWMSHQLSRFGGRLCWVAHHLIAIHKFLEEVVVGGGWDTEYTALHRLTNYEQSLRVMADVFDIDNSWVPSTLTAGLKFIMSESDWALEGLKEFAQEHIGKKFTAQTIAKWAEMEDEYDKNTQLTNGRSLGRYMQSHKRIIESVCGIVEQGTYGNRKQYTAKEVEE